LTTVATGNFGRQRHFFALAWAESSAFVPVGGVAIAQRLADFAISRSLARRKSRYCHDIRRSPD
jgi:hypothetical protein